MDKKMLMAIVLSMGILMAWPLIVGKKAAVQEQVQVSEAVKAETETVKTSAEKTVQDTNKTELAIQTNSNVQVNTGVSYFLENQKVKVEFSDLGAVIKQVTFKKYSDNDNQNITFFSNDMSSKGAFSFVGAEGAKFKVLENNPNSLIFKYVDNKEDLKITYTLETDAYVLNTSIQTANPKNLKIRLATKMDESKKEMYGLAKEPEQRIQEYVYFNNNKAERDKLEKLDEDGSIAFSGNPKWYGLANSYFLISVLNNYDLNFSVNKEKESSVYFINAEPVKATTQFDYKLYLGPKEVNNLRSVEPTLSESIDFGWLTIISVPMLELLKFFYTVFPNYGFAIILLTLVIRLVMYPLQHKSMKSMKRLQELQPHIKKLQEQHKNDKQKMNQEVMQFMKTHKVNPMGGCFPMLLQLPVFIALYKVLGSAVELYRSPFIFWITDLSAKDPFYVLPILMGLMMVVQQKLTPNPTVDPMQAKMMMFMPIIFTFFMINLPSGLTLYIMFSTALGIAQQYMVNRKKSN